MNVKMRGNDYEQLVESLREKVIDACNELENLKQMSHSLQQQIKNNTEQQVISLKSDEAFEDAIPTSNSQKELKNMLKRLRTQLVCYMEDIVVVDEQITKQKQAIAMQDDESNGPPHLRFVPETISSDNDRQIVLKIFLKNIPIIEKACKLLQQTTKAKELQIKLNCNWTDNVPWIVGAGICNEGHTCYAAAIIQMLGHLAPITNWLQFQSPHAINCKTTCVESVHCNLAANIESLRGNIVASPTDILDKMRLLCQKFDKGFQHDAHEFLVALTYEVNAEMANLQASSPFTDVFCFEILQSRKCMLCETTSTTSEKFTHLQLPMNEATQLTKIMARFFRTTVNTDSHNLYDCSVCNAKTSFTEFCHMESTPQVLVLQLKRFQYISDELATKNNTYIEIPLQLDVSSFVGGDKTALYNLIATVNHYGESTNSGHYTTSIRNPQSSDNQWFEMDDLNVRKSKLNGRNVYMAIYEKSLMNPVQTQKPEASPLPTSHFKTRPQRNIARKTYVECKENDDGFVDFSEDEEEYQPNNDIDERQVQRKTYELSDSEEDCTTIEDEPQLFQRNIPIRSTPLNTKRKIRSGNGKQKVVELMADLEVTQLRHKRPFSPANNGTLPDVVSGPSAGASILNYQQKIELRKWIEEERGGRHKMKNGAIQRLVTRTQNNFNLKLNHNQVKNIVKRNKLRVKEDTRVFFTDNEKQELSRLKEQYKRDKSSGSGLPCYAITSHRK